MIENIKIIKGFGFFFLSVHISFVVFTVENLEVFLVAIKPAYVRLLLVMIIIIFAWSSVLKNTLGEYYGSYVSLSKGFINTLIYCLGFKLSKEDEFGIPKNMINTNFYLFIGQLVIMHITINYALSIACYFYSKISAENEKVFREQSRLDKEKRRRRKMEKKQQEFKSLVEKKKLENLDKDIWE